MKAWDSDEKFGAFVLLVLGSCVAISLGLLGVCVWALIRIVLHFT